MTDQTERGAPAGAPVLYTVPEACAILKVSRTTLWRLTNTAPVLYSIRVGKQVRYPSEALDAYIAGRRFDPAGATVEGQPDLTTWPPTPSLFMDDSGLL